MKKTNLRRQLVAAIMGAIAFILMYINVPVPFLSAFAELDLSSLPELIGGFMLGPVGAIEIIIIKILLILFLKGTSTMYTGELQNLILSLCYVLPAVLYYRHNKTKKGAIIGLIIGALTSIIVSVFTNLYLIFPTYIKLFGMDWDKLISLYTAVNPYITSVPTLVAFSVVPFNIVSRLISAAVAILVYKKISIPMKKFMQ